MKKLVSILEKYTDLTLINIDWLEKQAKKKPSEQSPLRSLEQVNELLGRTVCAKRQLSELSSFIKMFKTLNIDLDKVIVLENGEIKNDSRREHTHG